MLILSILLAVAAPAVAVAPAAVVAPAALAAAVPAYVSEALERAVTIPGARVDVRWFRANGSCAAEAAEVTQPVSASGRVPVRLRGLTNSGPCEAWGWAEVKLLV